LTFTPTAFIGDTNHPALYISQGTLLLNGNAFTVKNASGTPLGVGTYRLIQQASGSLISSGNYSVNVAGGGLVSGDAASIECSGGNVNLVVTPPGPESFGIQIAMHSGSSFTFDWSTVTNQMYQIQSTTNLAQGNWTNSGATFIATNSTMTISEGIGANSGQFYRVVLLP